MKILKIELWWWLIQLCKYTKNIKLYTLNEWILYHLNYISVKLSKNKKEIHAGRNTKWIYPCQINHTDYKYFNQKSEKVLDFPQSVFLDPFFLISQEMQRDDIQKENLYHFLFLNFIPCLEKIMLIT